MYRRLQTLIRGGLSQRSGPDLTLRQEPETRNPELENRNSKTEPETIKSAPPLQNGRIRTSKPARQLRDSLSPRLGQNKMLSDLKPQTHIVILTDVFLAL